MIVIRSISLVMLMGIFACNGKAKNQSTDLAGEIEKIKLVDLRSQPINLSKYKGKTIFINFWATWCKPCIEEMPTIADAQKILQKEPIIFLLASNESAEEIIRFSESHDYHLNYIRIENLEALNIEALPATFIYNKKGNLVFSDMGYRKWNERNNIDTLLKIVKGND